MANLQVKRGTDAQRLTITPVVGELIYTTDTKNLYIGDGVTVGGVLTNADILVDGAESGSFIFSDPLDSSTASGVSTVSIVPATPSVPGSMSAADKTKLDIVPSAIGIPTQVLQVNAGATALEYVNPSGGGGISVVATTAELMAAENLGAIAFINGSGVSGVNAIRRIEAQGPGDTQRLIISAIDTVANTVTITRESLGFILLDNTEWNAASSNTASDGTNLFLGSISDPSSGFQFQTTSSGAPGSRNNAFSINIVTGGSAGVVVNSTNFPIGQTLYAESIATLNQGNWYGFERAFWRQFTIV